MQLEICHNDQRHLFVRYYLSLADAARLPAAHNHTLWHVLYQHCHSAVDGSDIDYKTEMLCQDSLNASRYDLSVAIDQYLDCFDKQKETHQEPAWSFLRGAVYSRVPHADRMIVHWLEMESKVKQQRNRVAFSRLASLFRYSLDLVQTKHTRIHRTTLRCASLSVDVRCSLQMSYRN